MKKKWLFALLLLAVTTGAGIYLGACGDDDDDDDNDAEGNDDDDNDDDDNDDNDAEGSDDDDNDDDAAGPTIVDVERTDCKGNSKDKDDQWPESLEFAYSNDTLTVTHVNGVFNCCIERIDVTIDGNGQVLDLYEVEYAPQPCDCICPYDVTTQIAGLDSGAYSVNVYVNGTLSISGETTIP